MSPITTVGEYLSRIAFQLLRYANDLTFLLCLVVLLLVIARYLTDRFNVNPFGRVPFYLRRPTDGWFYHLKHSQLYFAAKKAFGFDPIWLLMGAGVVLVYLMLPSLIGPIIGMLQAISTTLSHFGAGRVRAGIAALVGTVLLTCIYSLLLMMLVMVVNFFFGILARPAQRAGTFIYPLINLPLSRFDPSGRFFPIFFILLSFVLQLLASFIAERFF